MTDNHVSFLPPQLAEEVHRWAPSEVSGSEMYTLARLAERIYAEGYDNGHRRGYAEGYDCRQRPNVNDVNRLREALVAEREASR